MEFEVLKFVLAELTTHYQTPQSWDTPPAVPLTWYWEILDRTCQLVKPVKGSLDLSWCHEGEAAVPLLAQVYSAFNKAFSKEFIATPLPSIPNAVKQCRDDHMRRYFEWVQEMQQSIHSWQQKILGEDWTDKDIKDYASVTNPLHKIAVSLHIEALEVRMEDVESMKTEMQELKPLVMDTLIRIDSDRRRYMCVHALCLCVCLCVHVWVHGCVRDV